VSPFGRRKAPAPTDEEQRSAEVDLERIRQGGIPLGAEERLKRVATASTPFFTSDLSAKEYALAQAGGLQPVAQVMGSSVVQQGWVGANDIVISTLRHTIEHHEYEQTGYRYHYFHVTMNVLGTAIRLGAREPHPSPLTGPVTTMNLGV
jgi:hypothetical protein